MKPPVERIKLSQAAKNQLITIKKRTKIENWNTICRWAFCVSLAEEHAPSPIMVPADSSVEMTWQTFAGDLSDVLINALRQWCHNHGLDPEDEKTLTVQFRLHLHRGIAYIAGNPHIKSIEAFLNQAVPEEEKQDKK